MNFEPILYGPLFIRDAQDINLVAASADPVNLTVSVGGSSWTIPVTPVLTNNRYLAALRMREILSSVVGIPGLANAGEREVPLVTLSAGDATMSVRAVYGAASGKTPTQLAGHWLSWRDQVSTTHAWGRERLTFLAGLDLLGWQSGTYSVKAKIFLSSGDPVTVTLTSGTLQSGCRYVTVDASYATIAAAVSSSVRSKIRAWDVSYSFSGTDSQSAAATINGYPLRLIIARDEVRVKEFVFCNSFGVEDRVYSSGRSNPKLDGSSVAFLSGATEYELRNDSTEGREVYSGRLGSARESALWLDFLKAHDRYILASGGLARIIVDSQETDLQDNALGSVKFTYHLGALDNGRYFNDQEGLGDYDPAQRHGALYIGDEPPSEELPSEDLFFLKTRLDEFPVADLSEECLFLVQDPLTLEWCNAPLSDIKEWLQQVITHEDVHVWSGPWEDYSVGVAGYALAASLGKDLCDRIETLENAPAYQLPIATATRLGGIKVGSGLSITAEGVLSAVDACYFEPDPDYEGNVILKTAYAGLRIPGLRFGDGAEDLDLEVEVVNGQRVIHSRLPLYSDYFISSGGLSQGGGQPAGNASYTRLDNNGGTITNGTDSVAVYSRDYIDAALSHAGAVKKVAGVSPDANGDVPVSNLKTALGIDTLDGNLSTISGALQSLQSQVDAVASRDNFDELTASALFANVAAVQDLRAGSIELAGADLATTLTGLANRATALEGYFTNGSAKTAVKLLNSRTIWGQSFDGTANVSGALTDATTITASTSVTAPKFYLSSSVYFELDANGHVHLVTPSGKGFYADGFVSSGGLSDGGGSGGIDPEAMWELLEASTNEQINGSHLTTALSSFVNAVVISGTGDFVASLSKSGHIITATMGSLPTALKNPYALTFGSKTYDGSAAVSLVASDIGALTSHQSVTLASGTNNGTLKLTTAAGTVDNIAVKGLKSAAFQEASAFAAASHTHAISDVTGLDGNLSTISGALQSLQSQVDAVASRDNFDELTASALFADVAAVQDLRAGSIELAGADLATTLTGLANRATTLEGYFTNGSAKTAVKLLNSRTIWGQSFDGTANVSGALTDATTITASTSVIAPKFYLSSSVYFELDVNGHVHLVTPSGKGFYADGFVSSGGLSDGGGSASVDLDAVWASLTNSASDSHVNDKIAAAHIPDMAGTYSYVKTSAIADMATKTWVTGQGYVTSSGVTSITAGTGLSGGTITGTGTIAISSTYQTYISHGETAYNDLSTVSNALQSLQAQADSIASRDCFDELSASALFADVLAASAAYVESLELGGESMKSIPNSYLANSAITINGTSVALGGSYRTATLTAGTAGTSSATSGASFSIPYVTMNAYGIVTGYGTHTHSISQANIFGSSAVGSSALPVYYNGSALTACTKGDLFSALSSSAATNLSATVAGQTRSITNLYATYDSASENISDKFGIVSSALQSLQRQVDAVASRFEDLTYGHFDTIAVTGIYAESIEATKTLTVAGAAYLNSTVRIGGSSGATLTYVSSNSGLNIDKGLYSNGYVTGGASNSSSDTRLKDGISPVKDAMNTIMALKPSEWVWNEKHFLKGSKGAGLVAQDVESVLPFAVSHETEYLALNYNVFHAYEIAGLQDHERRIRELERENEELKKRLNIN